MALVSPATLERIRAANDIVETIQSVVPLKRAGANFVALCPFHKEKTPSFSVSPQKQIFYCFGCHKGGDVFKFLELYESLSFPEALKRLADRAHIPLEFERRDSKAAFLKDQLLQIHEQLAARWQQRLWSDACAEVARQYLLRRKVDSGAAQLFRLGFAPDLWDDTVNWGKSNGFDPRLLEQAGVVIARPGGGYYDRFRGRLIFPIHDEQGRVVAFSGRILQGDEKTAKYVNSPETPIFTKGRIFFGFDKSRRAIADAGFAVVCEGQLDLIRCFTAGVKNIVAPQGTAFTADHARILKRYADEVVLCFDSDNAGQNAAIRALDAILTSGLAARVAVIPAPHDPDSFVRENGAEAFQRLISGAANFFDFYLDRLCREHDLRSDKGRAQVVEAMRGMLRKTGRPILVDTYAQKTALCLGVSADAIRSEFKKGPAPNRRAAEAEAEEISTPAPARPSALEWWLLKLIFLEEDQVPWLEANLSLDWLANPAVRRIVSLRWQAHQQGAWAAPASFLRQLESEEDRTLLNEILMENDRIRNPATQAGDILGRLRNQALDKQLAQLQLRLGDPALDDSARTDLLRKQIELRERKRTPLPLPAIVSAP